MSIEKVNLRKLLQLFVADARQQRSLLLADIRTDKAKQSRESDNGGDFYTPFWADVKAHAAGRSNIMEQTALRISKNKTRAFVSEFARWLLRNVEPKDAMAERTISIRP